MGIFLVLFLTVHFFNSLLAFYLSRKRPATEPDFADL